jgi:hypothetical protein
MFQKSRILVVATMAAGTIGLWASAAVAGTGGDNGGLVNLSHNQVPLQGCGNEIPVNVLGVQVPIDRIAASLGLLNPEPAAADQDSSCQQGSMQGNDPSQDSLRASASRYSMSGAGWGWHFSGGATGDNGGLVNLSHNQVPVQVCNNRIPVNVLGVQVPVSELAGALGLVSPGGVTAVQDSGCKQGSGQSN